MSADTNWSVLLGFFLDRGAHFSISTIQKLSHFSDFTHYSKDTFDISQIVLNFGLYEAIVIDTLENKIETSISTEISGHSSTSKHISRIEVSKDIKALNLFLKFAQSVMLPCPECGRNQTFFAKIATTPQNSPKTIEQESGGTGNRINYMRRNLYHSESIDEKPSNVFDTCLEYQLGNDNLSIYSYKADFLESDLNTQSKFIAQCCVKKIIQKVAELRKEFTCSFDPGHKIFADFIIYKASDCCNESAELRDFRERKTVDESITMTEDEQKIFEQYDKLKYCLIFEKVGQEPSMADLQLFDIKKYSKVLSKERYNDFSLALGLYASGVGCGSLLYLRRVFESIVETIQEKCSKKKDWNAEEYSSKRFNEKISYLEKFGEHIIPDELAGIKSKIYGLLSKGVHELSEQEAKELFPYLKYSIELILDNQIAQKEREEKIKTLNSKLNLHF